ncbi:conserved Plasmodium protein, unknown function [Plasmodium sp. gorilla clade G2]|uniref:conserved Plasmodium protein, unknown function n=1 Tax=Plasmodium sp. gorilla clade G2 TaxID=880535 RepID=UPI000D21BFCB|nr:conserved Plasmodium protein, unknown function [Plasmodium sp. gorilla clade G2]SOV12468.1 conserved Plasmodium protein, unknown function [Plasmodium sp. gorilla clade G2]
MFNFFNNLEIAKNKIINHLHKELFEEKNKDESYFIPEERNMNCCKQTSVDLCVSREKSPSKENHINEEDIIYDHNNNNNIIDSIKRETLIQSNPLEEEKKDIITNILIKKDKIEKNKQYDMIPLNDNQNVFIDFECNQNDASNEEMYYDKIKIRTHEKICNNTFEDYKNEENDKCVSNNNNNIYYDNKKCDNLHFNTPNCYTNKNEFALLEKKQNYVDSLLISKNKKNYIKKKENLNDNILSYCVINKDGENEMNGSIFEPIIGVIKNEEEKKEESSIQYHNQNEIKKNNQKDVSVETEFYMNDSLLDSLEKVLIKNVSLNFGREDYINLFEDIVTSTRDVKGGNDKKEINIKEKNLYNNKYNNNDGCSDVCEKDKKKNDEIKKNEHLDMLSKLLMSDMKSLFTDTIYCYSDLNKINNFNNMIDKYIEEIKTLKKKEKILNDINERQTYQLLQLSGQISHIKTEQDISHDILNDDIRLSEKYEYMEKEIKKLEKENENLQNLLKDKMTYMKQNFQLKCYIQNMQEDIKNKNFLYTKINEQKHQLENKLIKYYEYIQIIKEDLYGYKKLLYDIKINENNLVNRFKMFLRNHKNWYHVKYYKRGKGSDAWHMQTKRKKKKKKKKKKYAQLKGENIKTVKLLKEIDNDMTHENYDDNMLHDNNDDDNMLHDNNDDNMLHNNNNGDHNMLHDNNDDHNMLHNNNNDDNMLHNNNNDDNMLHNNNDDTINVIHEKASSNHHVLSCKTQKNTTIKNISNYNLTKNCLQEELINKINYYKYQLDEYKSIYMKNKNNAHSQLRETKKLLSYEIKKNKMIEKKYEHLSNKFQDIYTTFNDEKHKINNNNNNKNDDNKNPCEKDAMPTQELLNEINLLTEEIKKFKEDQILLQQDVNNKSKIISHLIKKHALSEEHFRLDKSFNIFNNKLTYDEMKKVMEETLIENIRLRTDLMTLAKSINK